MSAVSPPAATSAVSPANITGNLPMAEFWRAGLEYIARGVMAYQSAAQQTRLADAYSGRRSTTHAVAAAARQTTEQVGLHKEAFEDCVRALSGLAPGGLPVASSSDESVLLNTRITTLEAQVDRLAEKIEPVESRLVPLGDALARIESGRKAREDNLARVIAQVEKSHEQLEGRVTSLSNQVASNGVPESHASATAHNSTVEPRITSPETKTKQRTGIKDLQEQLKGQSSRLESLETDLRDVMSQTEKIRGHVEPLLPLTPQVDTLLTTHARIESVNNELVDLREKSRLESAQVDLLKNSCESVSQNLEAIKLNTLDSFLTNVTSIFPSKEHIATLKTLSGTVDVLQQTVSSFTPLQTHVRSLEELAAKSTPLLSVASEHEELTQNMKQLQGDMTQHSHDISQVLSTTAALEQQVQGLGTLRTEVRGLIERFEAAKETINGIRTLGEQVAKLNALDHPTTQNIAEIERRIACLESREDDLQAQIAAAASLKDKVTALEATSTAIETVKSRMASFKPLKKHIPELLALATQSESLASLIPTHKTTCEDLVRLRDDVKRDSEEGRLQLAELEKKVLGLGVTHPDVQTLAEELKSIKETTDTLHPLSQKFETLSSTTQDTLATLTKTTNRIPELEDEMGFIHDRIQDVLENLAALDPVKEQAEGLVLLAGRAELLVSLPEQFTAVSSDVGELRADWASLTRKTARVKKKLDQYEANRTETTPPTARSRDQTEEDSNDSDELQRRLDTFEREMKSLKSKVSKASTKMGEFERTLNLEETRAKRTSEMLQLNKDDIVALLPLTNNVEVLVSLADQKAPLTSLVQDSQKVRSFRPRVR
ncbi:hypothetical protein BDV93DRAFT_282086 [Ceratobasidium sp. AG-I]|nr:hypothetical protein BDV93DRAFT_282086 [Ceratobasidium sp. AG-I]